MLTDKVKDEIIEIYSARIASSKPVFENSDFISRDVDDGLIDEDDIHDFVASLYIAVDEE